MKIQQNTRFYDFHVISMLEYFVSPIETNTVPNDNNLKWYLFMLWSQIKLTSYDFSDLHITGEFDNRPGAGRFLRIFSCVVTYRTGAGRRLYIKTSADVRPGTVRCLTLPGRRCKRSAGHRTVPGRFNTNFSRAMINTFISKFAIFPPNKQVVTKERLTDSDSDGDENHTCSRLQRFQ